MRKAWPTRIATIDDLKAITDLCIATMGQDDYVIFMLEDLITNAKTVIIEDQGKVIGTTTYRMQKDGSAWLSSARTHPDYRRQGVAAAIMHRCEDIAKEEGVRQLRLWTEGDNEEGKGAFIGLGFKEVGRFTRMSAPPAEGLVEELRLLSANETLWQKIRRSEMMTLSRGYFNHGFGFLKLTSSLIKTLGDEGYLYGWGPNVGVMSYYMFASQMTLEGQVLLDDPRKAIADLPAITGLSGLERVHIFIPSNADLIAAARASGFDLIEWGYEAILCEKEVARDPSRLT